MDRDGWSDTPLHYAVAGQQPDVIEFLLSKGAGLAAYGPAVLNYAEGNIHTDLRRRMTSNRGNSAAMVGPECEDSPESRQVAQKHKVAIPRWDRELSDNCSRNMNATDDPERVRELIEKAVT